MQKLPSLLQRKIVEYNKGTKFNLTQFGQALDHLVDTYEQLETFEDVKTPKVKNSDIKIHQVSAKVESEQLSGPRGTLQQRSSTPARTLSASKVAVQPAQGERYNLRGVQTNASQLMHHIKCHLCEKPHASISCHIFKNAMQRRDRLTELRLF